MASMTSVATTAAHGRAQQIATRLSFMIAGVALAAWAPLVPFVKVRAGLDEGQLGLLLLCLGAGSLLAMPWAGAMAPRFGCRKIVAAAVALVCVSLPLLAILSSIPLLAATLFAFGAGVGAIDCTMNLQAVMVERAAGRPMMSGFHGLFSVGGIVGAAGSSALMALGLTPFATTLVVVAGIVVTLAAAMPGLLPRGSGSAGPSFVAPHGIVLLIGLMCCVVFLTEGAALDWSAVFLVQERGMAPAFAGIGYAAFAATMTIGRLAGDRIVRGLGAANVLVFGSLCAAGGMLLASLAPAWEAAVIGYALLGAGCSNIVPVLYTAVGRQKAMPENLAVAAVTTLGYAGILAGPAGIGFVARASSLSVAFALLAVPPLVVAASGRVLAGRRSG